MNKFLLPILGIAAMAFGACKQREFNTETLDLHRVGLLPEPRFLIAKQILAYRGALPLRIKRGELKGENENAPGCSVILNAKRVDAQGDRELRSGDAYLIQSVTSEYVPERRNDAYSTTLAHMKVSFALSNLGNPRTPADFDLELHLYGEQASPSAELNVSENATTGTTHQDNVTKMAVLYGAISRVCESVVQVPYGGTTQPTPAGPANNQTR